MTAYLRFPVSRGVVSSGVLAGVVFAWFALARVPQVRGEVTAEQRRSLNSLKANLTKTGNLFKQKKYADCGDSFREALQLAESLAAIEDSQFRMQLRGHYQRLVTAHGLLAAQGVEVPKLKSWEELVGPTPDGGGEVQFTKDVAPILVSRCGRCHVNNSRGMFSMATYEALMKGPPAGVVIRKGSEGGRLIEVIEGKEMPPNGSGIPDAELATIKRWVTAGAKFDGPDPKANLRSLVPAAPDRPALQVTQATGDETIHFALDIAPILVEACSGCHGGARGGSANFSLATFEGLLRGGDSGEPIIPGKPDDSLLIRKLKGTAGGQRMPLRSPPLADEVIAKLVKWIEEGATFDGANPAQPIREVWALAKAQKSTHEELSQERLTLAGQNWQLGMPGIASTTVETTSFLLVGNVGDATLQKLGEQAEAIAPKVAAALKRTEAGPLIKGRFTLFVFGRRFEYSEFGQMVERRELPKAWHGHWKFNVIDAYGALILPGPQETKSVETTISQLLAGTYIASLGDVPTWFSDGSGRTIAARLFPRDPEIAAWDQQLESVLALSNQADDFLTGKLPPERAEIAAYSFVKYLMRDNRRYQKLLQAIGSNGPFDKVFADVYGGQPKDLAARWIADATPKPGRSRKR